MKPVIRSKKIAFVILLSFVCFITKSQTSPRADHHTHLWSLNASKLITQPLMEMVTLPEELQQLLEKKQKYGGRNKDAAELSKLYTSDILHLNPLSIKWIKGDDALAFIIKSTTTFQLFPTSYNITGNAGYIAGYQTRTAGEVTEYISNFYYGINKGIDDTWRISSEMFTMKGPPQAKAITADKLIAELNVADIKKAAVLSTAFWFGSPTETVTGDVSTSKRGK